MCDLSDGIMRCRQMCNQDSRFNGVGKVYDPSQRIVVPFCNAFYFYKPGRG